jgi:hypothetical protein
MIGGQREERYAIPRAMSSMIYDAASDDMEREMKYVRQQKKKIQKQRMTIPEFFSPFWLSRSLSMRIACSLFESSGCAYLEAEVEGQSRVREGLALLLELRNRNVAPSRLLGNHETPRLLRRGRRIFLCIRTSAAVIPR